MGIVAVLSNYFILLPLFEQFMPMEQLIAPFAEFIPFIHTADYKALQNIKRKRIVKNYIQFGVDERNKLCKRSDQLFHWHKLFK